MTDIERLSSTADVPIELAALVVLEAASANVSLREFRRNGRPASLTRHKRRLVKAARAKGYSWWQIGRAINRDHSTCIYNHRMAVAEARA